MARGQAHQSGGGLACCRGLASTAHTCVSQEHFKDAKTLRDELRKMHIDDSSSVLRANSDFYKAFTSKNITLMGAVWQDSDTVQCVQPGSR